MSERIGSSSLYERRFAANQTVFRRSNERLRRRLGVSPPLLVAYVCECGDDECEELISLSSSGYEHIRSNAAWFLIAHDHEILPDGAERIIERHSGYQVAEKTGAPGALAEATNPRALRGTDDRQGAAEWS